MRQEDFELTYCSNIHPATGWPDVFGQLRLHAPPLKKRIAPNAPFGLGVRLSSDESIQLLDDGALHEFQEFLKEEGLYVFTLNGFPYGPFHGGVVKSAVFFPDWRSDERVQYTLRLIKILETLLPEGGEGGISTLPLSYKEWIAAGDETSWEAIVHNLIRIAEALVWVEQKTGKEIHLDLEPEPDGLVESGMEAIAFFERRLLPIGGKILAERLQVGVGEGERLLQKYITLCLDTSHMAVIGESEEIIDRYLESGVRIGKVQLSAAMLVSLPEDPEWRQRVCTALAPFADTTYLHQVAEQSRSGRERRYVDLIDALPEARSAGECEWRIHFHLPLDFSGSGPIQSTSDLTARVLRRWRSDPFSRHLEIETYTWSVLPGGLKRDLLDSIEREYRWVLPRLMSAPSLTEGRP